MGLLSKIKFAKTLLKKDLRVYQMALKDPRTPKAAKALLLFAIGYIICPFDLIPDFIPVIGRLDEVVLVPLIIRLALSLIPHEVLEDCRFRAGQGTRIKTHSKRRLVRIKDRVKSIARRNRN